MQLASWVLVTSTLVAPSTRPATTDAGVRADEKRPAVSFAAAQQRSTIVTGPVSSAPTYRFGLGGSIVVSNRGIGASSRYWFTKHIGVSAMAAWRPGSEYMSYSPLTGATSRLRTSTTITAAPSLMVMLNETDPNREVSFRPYMGVGAGYIYGSRVAALGTTPGATTTLTYSGRTDQAYAGTEMFFRDYQNLAISAEMIYINVPNSFVNRRSVDGLNFQLAAHFYLK
jgi:outer membrane protein W